MNPPDHRPGATRPDPTLRLPAPLVGSGTSRRVLDLFAGVGGLSTGFRSEGFEVIGVDREEISHEVFSENAIGDHITADLTRQSIVVRTPVLVGGPPCRPWSVMNVQRRRGAHEQYRLLERFFEHVMGVEPFLFLMENVPSVKKDPRYVELLQETAASYSVAAHVMTYSDFGAATKRRRLITVGVQKGLLTAADFFVALDRERRQHANVGERIRWLRDMPRNGFPDHDWSQLRTIDRYEARYRSGRFGWTKLTYDSPAPSFGSVAKTYILHPEAGVNGFPKRVVSVREVMLIMGFERGFRLPVHASRTRRYQLAADAVSPVFSAACARVTRRLLWGDGSGRSDGRGLEQP